jgi:hypothetical protein
MGFAADRSRAGFRSALFCADGFENPGGEIGSAFDLPVGVLLYIYITKAFGARLASS